MTDREGLGASSEFEEIHKYYINFHAYFISLILFPVFFFLFKIGLKTINRDSIRSSKLCCGGS